MNTEEVKWDYVQSEIPFLTNDVAMLLWRAWKSSVVAFEINITLCDFTTLLQLHRNIWTSLIIWDYLQLLFDNLPTTGLKKNKLPFICDCLI